MSDMSDQILERVIEGFDTCGKWQDGRKHLFSIQNPVSGSDYHGINTLILFLNAMQNGYSDNRWCTMRQANKIGTSVKKGSKSEVVIFWKMLKTKETGSSESKTVPLLRWYRVFNFEQLKEIPDKYKVNEVADFEIPEEPKQLVDRYLDWASLDVERSNDTPYYSPGRDIIGMPPVEDYFTAERYFESFIHECVHSTGHSSRLKRPLDEGAFNKAAYSREELIAEFGTAMLLDRLGILTDMGNLSAYIKNWHKALKENSKDLIVAAGKAERAVDYILGKEVPVEQTDACSGSSMETGERGAA